MVAIKIASERYSERFQLEARAISTLNHPNICTLYDVGPNYLVMEFIEGATLAAEIKRGSLAPELAARYGSQIANALAEAHSLGIVHRDLKPSNIMVTRHGIKVLDFGLAKIVSDTGLTRTGGIMGTPAYMAPEQVDGREPAASADLFALGLVLYEMAVGRLPFPGASLGQMLSSGSQHPGAGPVATSAREFPRTWMAWSLTYWKKIPPGALARQPISLEISLPLPTASTLRRDRRSTSSTHLPQLCCWSGLCCGSPSVLVRVTTNR